MKKTLLIISAASLLLVGCAKEQLVEKSSYTGPVTVVSATFESLVEDGATKATVSEEGEFTWQNGDKAAFAESSSSTSYCFGTNNVAGATAQFAIEGLPTFTNSSWAIYPYDLTTDQTPNTLKVKVPASREWAVGQTNVAMYGVKETSSFIFSHMGGLVRVRVKNVPTNAREFVFKASGCKINGEFSVTTVSESKVIETVASDNEDEQTYTLTWTTDLNAENTMDFYIPLPVGDYNGGFAFYLKDESHNTLYSKVGSTPQTIARKKLLLMPAITLVGGSIEPAEKAAVVANIPAGYSGDFLLPQSEKVLLKINASTENHDITLKYDGANNIPTNLEIKVIDGDNEGNYGATLLGNLPYTHVEFTKGTIANVEMTTSSSTLEVIYPAIISTKLTVKGGNVKIKGATVQAIEVDSDAVADSETGLPVQIAVEKYTPEGGAAQTPTITEGITANASIVVAPDAEVTVSVQAEGGVQVAKAGEGSVTGAATTDAQAKIGENNYFTLADAVKAAPKNATEATTITLLDNVTDGAGIFLAAADKKNIVIDLNTKTYTAKNVPVGSPTYETQAFHFEEGNKVTIKDGTLNVSSSADEQMKMLIQNYCNLTLTNVAVDGTNLKTSNSQYVFSNNCGTIVLDGTTSITAPAEFRAFDVYKFNNGSYDYPAPTVTVNTTGTITGQVEVTGGTLVVDAGSFTHSGTTIWAKSGNVTINNGSFASTGNCAIGVTGTTTAAPTVTLKNGTFNSQESTVLFDGVEATVSIEGGTYYATDNAVISGNGTNRSGNANNVTISGGTFNGGITSPGYIACGIYAPWKDNITVTGGTFNITNGAGVVARAGVVTINGGTFKCTGTTPGKVGDKAVNLPCECLIFDDSDPNYPAKDENSKIVVNGGTFSDLSGLKYVAESGTYKLANDVNLGENILEINSGKAFSIDLNGKTLTGRTNIKHGNVTFKNGNIAGGNKQALNVYGSATEATNYSVVTVDSDVAVTAEVFGVCLFGPTFSANVGYGAGVNIKGTITTTKPTSSNEGAIFVSGNLGNSQSADIQTAMEGKNFVNISGEVTSASDAALALQGSATATITGKLTGNTGIAAKRGNLIVKENAGITGKGTCVGNPTKNGNGTELTGSAVSASSTYGQRLTIDLQGGTYTSAAYTILNNADDAACSFTISGGKYETTKAVDGIAVYARLGSVKITGGTFENNSNSEATLHVGCPAAVNAQLQPKLTISGDGTVVKNTASSTYEYDGGKPLVVNMANELTYRAVEISGGKFYYRDPSKDDYVQGDNGNFLKSGYTASGDDTNVWTVAASQQN